MHNVSYRRENDGQEYLEYEKHGVIARYNRTEKLWTVGRFNLRPIKMETGQQVRKHVRNLLETAED